MYSVDEEYFSIVHAPACAVGVLEWVHLSIGYSEDVLFDDSLHGLHHQGCESYGPKVVQSVYDVLLWNRDECGVSPQLGDCAGVHRPLKQDLKHSPQLLGRA